MAHTSYVWGARIYLSQVIPENTALGLYTSGTSELRWVEAAATLSGDTPSTWASNMLLDDLEALEQSADFSRGGAPAQMVGTTLRVSNTGQLSVTLAAYGETLYGAKVEIYEFTLGTDGVESAREVVFTGTVAEVRWSVVEVAISVEECSGKRRAQLLTVIDNDASGDYPNAADSENGVAIPATFGELSKAKMVRTAKGETIYSNTDLLTHTPTPAGLKQFPVVSATPATAALTYTVQICTSGSVHAALSISLDDKYMRVVDGLGPVGAMRKITAATESVNGTTGAVTIAITIASYFEETLSGNSTATATDNTWIEFVAVDQTYALDVWPCHAFMDDANPPAETSSPLVLFSYDEPVTVDLSTVTAGAELRATVKEQGFYPLPHHAYTESAGAEHNSVDIDAKLFDKTVDTMSCPRIIQIAGADISLPTDADLTNWGLPTAYAVSGCPGLYTKSVLSIPVTMTESPASGWPSALDQSMSTSEKMTYTIDYTLGHNVGFYHVTVFKVPTLPTDFQYDEVFLSIMYRFYCNHTWQTPTIKVATRRFMGNSTAVYEKTLDDIGGGGVLACPSEFRLYTTPDFHMNPVGSNSDEFWYVNEFYNPLGGVGHQYGKVNLQLDASEIKAGTVYEIAIIAGYRTDGSTGSDYEATSHHYELALALVNTTSIGDAIYTGIRGRTYNDTWGARKTAANLMQALPDIAEHTLRLQNWSEVGDNVAWGKAYAPNALIKTSGDGSWDDTTILGPYGGSDVSAWLPGDVTVARQVLDIADGYTDALIRSLCRAGHLCIYRDNDGYECARFIQTEEAAATAITLSQVYGRIQIEEPRARDVFVEPFVNYAYNYGSRKFDGTLRILNANDPGGTGWQEAYTPGLNSTGNLETGRVDGEVLWELCASLYEKFRRAEIPSSELTNCVWFDDYTSALWYLHRWILWMGKRRASFSVPYSVGRGWFVSERISINFPHETDAKTINCVIEKIRRDKNGTPSRVDVVAVMVDDIGIADIYQDTDAGSVPKWQDIDVGGTAVYQNID